MMRSLSAFLIWIVTAPTLPAAELAVRVTNIDALPGSIVARLYASERGFPTDPKAASGEAMVPVSGTSAELAITGVPPGRYALIVIHDENGDGLMEKTFLGLPEEGYGLSNNPRPLLAPRFADGVFEIKDGPNALEVALVYY